MYIIEYADGDCVHLPMGWDDDCDGAVCVASDAADIAMFSDRAAARRAIDISAKFAALCKAQGKPANDDFLPASRKHLRIRRCMPNRGAEPTERGAGP